MLGFGLCVGLLVRGNLGVGLPIEGLGEASDSSIIGLPLELSCFDIIGVLCG